MVDGVSPVYPVVHVQDTGVVSTTKHMSSNVVVAPDTDSNQLARARIP